MHLPRSRRGVAALLALVTLGGGLLRAATVSVQSLWVDELVTASLLRQGFGDMLAAIPTSERTPYLYYVLAWPVTRLLGDGEVGLRALSVLAGTLTIPVAYLAARELASRRVALATAALVAVNPLLVWYAQEARAYALLALLATAGLWLWARALARGDGLSLAGWAVASGLALATHYVALLVVVPQAALLVARPELRRRALAWCLVPAAVLAVHLPLLREQTGRSDAPISDASLAVRALGTLKAAVIGFGAPAELVVAIVAAALAGLAVVLALTRSPADERRGALRAGGLALLAFGAALALTAVGRDLVLARNLAAAVPAAVVVLAVGVVATRAGRLAGAALAALSLLVALAPALDATHGRTDWRGAAEALGPPPPGGRALVVTPSITPEYWSPYLPGLEQLEDEATVSEIVVVGLATEGGFGPGAVRPPAALDAPAPPGFVRVSAQEGATVTLVRYRAERPQRVTAEALAGLRLDEGTGRELLQPATG